MAVDVVVGLEEVDVDEEQGEGLAVEQGLTPLGLEALVEGAAVGEAGERVGVGELAVACFAGLQGVLEGRALFQQGGYGEGGEEGHGEEDLRDHDAVAGSR